jgi:hypothetical protein
MVASAEDFTVAGRRCAVRDLTSLREMLAVVATMVAAMAAAGTVVSNAAPVRGAHTAAREVGRADRLAVIHLPWSPPGATTQAVAATQTQRHPTRGSSE